MNEKEYQEIIVESFYPSDLSGKHGPVHIRPLSGQDPYLETMYVECSKDLSYNYPVGTRFRIKAKIVDEPPVAAFIYSHYKWSYTVLQG